jgi:hypothetical protein
VSVGVAVGKGVAVKVGSSVDVKVAVGKDDGTTVVVGTGNGVAAGVGAHAASMTNATKITRAFFMFAFSFERTWIANIRLPRV